jgi:hypothetical protein
MQQACGRAIAIDLSLHALLDRLWISVYRRDEQHEQQRDPHHRTIRVGFHRCAHQQSHTFL